MVLPRMSNGGGTTVASPPSAPHHLYSSYLQSQSSSNTQPKSTLSNTAPKKSVTPTPSYSQTMAQAQKSANNSPASSYLLGQAGLTRPASQTYNNQPAATAGASNAAAMATTLAGLKNAVATGAIKGTYTPLSSGGGGSSSGGMMQYGSNGSNVKYLQSLLNNTGSGLTDDGIFGNNTKVAVENFQKSHGLAVDGVVGPQTWQALMAAQNHGGSADGQVTITPGTPTHTGGTSGSNKNTSSGKTTTTPTSGTTTGNDNGNGSMGQGLVNTGPLGGDSGAQAINDMTGNAANILNGSMNNTGQWQSQAQQEAAASYIQQETAWQNYVNQLMDQEGLTDKGYQNQLNQSLNTLHDKSFQDYLQGRQDMADRGLAGSGLNAAQNTQLALAQQQQTGQLEQQMNQQKAANDTSYTDQMNQYKSQMDTLDPQALYDQYYQTISQAGQQAAQQQFEDWMKMLSTAGPYYSPTADQYGTLANNAQADQWKYLVDQQNANTNQYSAVSKANYDAGMLNVEQGKLQLQATDDAATIAQKNTQLNQNQQKIDQQAAQYAQQNANTANGQTVTAITKAMDNLTAQMDAAMNNGQMDTYNSLLGQWTTYNAMIQNFVGGGTSGN